MRLFDVLPRSAATADDGRLARLASRPQPVLLRINPSVPGRTHAAMDTGSPDAKFGVALDDAPRLLERIEAEPALELRGLHVHIGSQLLDLDGFGRAGRSPRSVVTLYTVVTVKRGHRTHVAVDGGMGGPRRGARLSVGVATPRAYTPPPYAAAA